MKKLKDFWKSLKKIKIKISINNDLEDIHSFNKKQKEDGKRNLNKRS